jgi:hypothetical protein
MNRDLLFVLMQTFPLLREWQLQTLARQHGIRKDRETGHTRQARQWIERSARCATAYKVDTDAIGLR